MRGTYRVFGLGIALIFSIFSFVASTNVADAVAPGFAPGETTRESLTNDRPQQAVNGAVRGQVLSADGRYVVFASTATNLGAGGTPGLLHVYRRNRLTNTVDVVDLTPAGSASSAGGSAPSVSEDGRYVVFVSTGSDLVRGLVDSNRVSDVFLRDMEAGVTSLVSATAARTIASAGGTLFGVSDLHVVSKDGDRVAFVSSSPDLGTAPANGIPQIYVKHMSTGAVTLASARDGVAGDGASSSPALSEDGRWVAFASLSTNLASPALRFASSEIYVRDVDGTEITLESVASDDSVVTGGQMSRPALSRHGNYLAFESTSQLESGDRDVNTLDVYLRDRDLGTTVLVSHSDTPTQLPVLESTSPSISADGRFIAFQSNDLFMVPGDRNGTVGDVYLYDRTTKLITIVSLNDDRVQANSSSTGPSLSSNGMLVLFASPASNLVAEPFTNTAQLYLRDYSNGAPVLEPLGRDYPLFEGEPLRLTWRFSDDDASTSWSATVDYRDGAGAERLRLNDDKTFFLSHLYAPGPHDLTVEVTDDAGAMGSLKIHVVVTNVAPTIGMVPSMDLGFARTLDATGTFTDPGSRERYTAFVNYGDGTATEPLALVLDPTTFSAGSFTLHHTYSSAGTYTVTVAVSDSNGDSRRAGMVVTIAPNEAPVLPALGRDYPLFESQPLRLTWEFSDDDASTSWNATVDYGDGAGEERLALNTDKTFVLDHLYAPGAYDLTVNVTDDAGARGSLVIRVVVTNVAPTVGLLATMDLAFTRTLDATGTFTDPGSRERYTASVNYGDGTASEPLALVLDATTFSAGSFTLRHTYGAAGTYTVTVAVSDSNGDSTRSTMVVKVGGYSYQWFDPVGSSFSVGRNLPVKFTVRGPDGSFVLDRTVKVDVVNDSGTVVVGYVIGDQPTRSVTVSGDSYHVNVDTRALSAGMYWLRVSFSSQTLTGEFSLGTTGTAASAVTTRTRISGLRD